MENTNRPYFKNLDILRFVAASLVLLGHCTTQGLSYLNAPYPIANFLKLITTGGHWVSLFFVLSGFLIGYLAIRDKKLAQFSFKKFFIRRILRIWPLYFLFIFIGYFFIPFIAKAFFGVALTYTYHTLWQFLLFIGNFAMAEMQKTGNFLLIPGSTSILWSISIEEQFYILLASLVLFINIKKIKYNFIALMFIGLAFIIAKQPVVAGDENHSLYYLLDFFFGGYMGYLFIQHEKLKLMFQHKSIPIILLFYLLLIIFSYPYILVKIALIPLFGLTILYLVCSNDKFNQKLSTQKWMLWGGKISYGIYVIHPIIQYTFYKISQVYLSNFTVFTRDMIVLNLTFPISFGLAYLSYRYYEKPFLLLKSKFY